MFKSSTLRVVSDAILDLVSSLRGENWKSPILLNNNNNNNTICC